MQLWVVICRWLGKHDGEVTALTKHAKLCLSSTPTKTGKAKAHKLSNLSRCARIVLKTSPGIAECERQKNPQIAPSCRDEAMAEEPAEEAQAGTGFLLKHTFKLQNLVLRPPNLPRDLK